MRFLLGLSPRARAALSITLAAVTVLAVVLGLALQLIPRSGAVSHDTSHAQAAKDENNEYQFWRKHDAQGQAAPSATATDAVSARSATPTAAKAPTATAAATPQPAAPSAVSLSAAFDTASQRYGVPVPLLEAVCYMEGRLSNNGGAPSIDNGFGCMHLVQNDRFDTLDQAARELGSSPDQLKRDLATNILGGAAILRDDALQVSASHTLPTSLGDWYGAVALYSSTSSASVARMYADVLYRLLNAGFSARAATGESISLAPQGVTPNTASASSVQPRLTPTSGCSGVDGKTDYPGAVDCILDPNVYDCNIVSPGTSTAPCSYDSANRPTDLSIPFVVIHDIEGNAASAITTFQNVNNQVSCHYIVGSDGTIYQVVHEKDIAFHAGNFWYNQHSIGIEHAGYDATGYEWYNATEYLASAKLTAYLLQKYSIPLDHNHVVSHGTVPSPAPQYMPNHVDPGPYWLWMYYFNLIHQQGVPFPATQHGSQMVVAYPQSSANPVPTGTYPESSTANFNFFSVYNGPSTASGLIPHAPSDITEETFNIEPGMTFNYLAKTRDQAGSGATMYEIYYGESDQLPNESMDGKLGWLALPAGGTMDSAQAALVGPWAPDGASVQLAGPGGTAPSIYGKPVTDPQYIIGGAVSGAIVASAYTAVEDGTTNVWYEINYNHRQAWVPASEVTALSIPPGGLRSLPTPTWHPA
jgi:N-acetyl-anhydromuramyl-L-alanine amidase AmpD